MGQQNRAYNEPTMAGRPPTKEAPPFGQRLAALRKSKGLSQTQLAKLIGTKREMIDYYERRAVNPSLQFIEQAAEALDVSVAELLGSDATQSRKRGPKSQLEKQIEAIGKLPRSKQQQIAAVIEAFISQHAER